MCGAKMQKNKFLNTIIIHKLVPLMLVNFQNTQPVNVVFCISFYRIKNHSLARVKELQEWATVCRFTFSLQRY